MTNSFLLRFFTLHKITKLSQDRSCDVRSAAGFVQGMEFSIGWLLCDSVSNVGESVLKLFLVGNKDSVLKVVIKMG